MSCAVSCVMSHGADAVLNGTNGALRKGFDWSVSRSKNKGDGQGKGVLILPRVEQLETCLGRQAGIIMESSFIDDKHDE